MAYDEALAARLRNVFETHGGAIEKKMFGGVAFMVNGNMCCGVTNQDLMVRVGPDLYEEALERPHARPMDFTGRPMKGMIYVDHQGFESDGDLQDWVSLGMKFVSTLPPK